MLESWAMGVVRCCFEIGELQATDRLTLKCVPRDRCCVVMHIRSVLLQVHGGQIVLMDAGCEYFGYASDVTRTWPVSGRYTPEQRAVYETVLSVRQQ